MALRTDGFRRRLRLVKLIPLVAAALVLWRTGQFLVPGHREQWQQRAEQTFFQRISLPAERGIIYDRYGNPLALNWPTIDLLQKVETDTLPRVFRQMGLKPKRSPLLKKRMAVPLKFHLSDTLEPIVQKYTKLLRATPSWTRIYPAGPATSSLLGMLGNDNRGLDGVEYFFDRQLAGRDGYKYLFFTRSRKSVFQLPELPFREPQPGRDLHLTIDRDLSELCYLALRHGVDSTRANWGFAVVMDPKTGDVLAMVSYPSADPARGVASTRNRTIVDPYEPGSVFKVVVYSLAYSRHLITPETPVDTRPGWIRVGRYRIGDVHAHGGRVMSYAEALVHSSNVAAAKLALQIPAEDLYRWARALGVGQRTGVELPGESPGRIQPLKRWKDVEKATFAIGHGVMVTGLQMAVIYSAIANGGLLLRPHVLAEGHPRPDVVRRVFRPGVADTLRQILQRVVEEGTGRRARIPGVAVAGKTGTAIKVNPRTRRYDYNRVITSFIGFLPADDPRYVINVVVDEPRVGKYGGDVAAPIFRRIAQGALALEAWRAPVAYHQGPKNEAIRTP